MSTPQENAFIARAHYESFNRREHVRGAELADPDVKWLNMPLGRVYRGRDGYLDYVRSWANAFPDLRIDVQNVVATGDWVAVEYTAHGTHRGQLVGVPNGAVPPTGRHVELAFCEMLQVRDGRIVSGRVYYDVASLLRQLGVTR